MNRISTITLLTVIIIGLSACTPRYSRSDLEPDALIPLSVGNSWNYVQVDGTKSGSAKVLKSSSHAGSSWFLYKEFGDIFWLKNEGGVQVEALNAFGEENLPVVLKEEIIFNSPDESPSVYESSGGKIQYRQCNEDLEVPAGRFPCHVYTIDLGDGTSSVNYYSQGVGLIRNDWTTDTGTVIFELTDYRVK